MNSRFQTFLNCQLNITKINRDLVQSTMAKVLTDKTYPKKIEDATGQKRLMD